MKIFSYKKLPFTPISSEVVYVDSQPSSELDTILTRYWRDVDVAVQYHCDMRFRYLPKAMETIPIDMKRYVCPSPHLLDLSVEGIPSQRMTHFLNDGNKGEIAPGLLLWTEGSIDRNEVYYQPIPAFACNTVRSIIVAVVKHLQTEAHKHDQNIMRSQWIDLDDVGARHSIPFRACIERSQPEETEADRSFDNEVHKLLKEARERIDALRARGVSEMVLQRLVTPFTAQSKMLITHDWRIVLPYFGDLEIEMRPLVKAVYFLFLCHPEGIRFKDLPDHRDELMCIYKALRGGELTDKARKSIEDVTDPTKNSINEKCARIREAFLLKMDESHASFYIVSGKRAQPKSVYIASLDDSVKWQDDRVMPHFEEQGEKIRIEFPDDIDIILRF